jgi:uncharacterized protein (TIGR00297 family)
MSEPRPFSEISRQTVHVAMGSLALLLRYLSAFEATLIAAIALVFNLYALRGIARHLYRPGEARRRWVSGITLYPLAILVLLLILPDRLDIVAGAWGVLAFGDGMATLAGRHIRSPRLPWNPGKTAAGTAAFVLSGGAAAAFLCWWCRSAVIPPPYTWFSIWMPILAAIAAAAVETIPIRLDDNISVPATAAAVLWSASFVSEDLAASAAAAAWPMLPLAAVANAAVAAAGYLARTVTMTGAMCGAVIGTTIVVTAGWGGWVLLLATFALAVVASRLGLRRKMQLGIAEERGGRRGAGNAFANTGIAAGAAVLGSLSYAHDAAHVAFVAALAAGGSDTVASEIGKAWGRRTFLVPSFHPVAPGTSGAVSAEGTAAGLLGAGALGATGVICGLIPGWALLAVVTAATAGSFAESLLSATLEARGIVNNDVLNFLNTAVAAAAAIFFADLFH